MAEPPAAADAFQRPLRSRFQARLSRSVRKLLPVWMFLLARNRHLEFVLEAIPVGALMVSYGLKRLPSRSLADA